MAGGFVSAGIRKRFASAAIVLTVVVCGVYVAGSAKAAVTAGPVATPSVSVPPLSNAFGAASSWEGICPPTSGSQPAPNVPPSSWASFLASKALAYNPDWVATVKQNALDAVHTGWDSYLEGSKGKLPPGFNTADEVNSFLQGRLQDVLTSDDFWAGVIQRLQNVSMPGGVDPMAFLGWLPDAVNGVTPACDDPFSNGQRLWVSLTSMFWQAGSQWAEIKFPAGGSVPSPRAMFLAIPDRTGEYLVLNPTNSYLPTATVGGILEFSPTPTSASCDPLAPSTTTTTGALAASFYSAAKTIASWIPDFPVPNYNLECDYVDATYTPITGPTVDANSVRVSNDAQYLLGWTTTGLSTPQVQRWTLNGGSYTDPVEVASGLPINLGFNAFPELAFSADGQTAAMCNIAPGGLSGSAPQSVARYPLIVHLDTGAVGWPQNGAQNWTECNNVTLNPNGTSMWWSQAGTDSGWWTTSTLTSAATPPPTVAVTGVTDGAQYDFGAVPAAGCSVTDSVDQYASATPVMSGPVGPRANVGLGAVTATCSYADSAGQHGTATVHYTIADLSPPVITQSADVTTEATGPAGASVTYPTPSATDLVDGPIPASCSPASGTTFPIGVTTVWCVAADITGNTAQASFSVTVRDTTPPMVSVPADIAVDATSPAGAAVTYVATATDLVDGTVIPKCSAVSGSTFPIGDTTVSCSAVDAHGNQSPPATFNVHVRSASEQAANLADAVIGVGTGSSLFNQMVNVQTDISAGASSAAIADLKAFENHVRAQSGKSLPVATAEALISAAQRMIRVLGD
jgi:hypothetical protein